LIYTYTHIPYLLLLLLLLPCMAGAATFSEKGRNARKKKELKKEGEGR
jgi:hypothetical protein